MGTDQNIFRLRGKSQRRKEKKTLLRQIKQRESNNKIIIF